MHDTNVISLKPLVASPSDRLGRMVLGCFRLDEVMGRGPHETTYLATQLGFDRRAVVKIAHAEVIDTRDADVVRRRFADELRAATRVTHDNLVTLYTAGETAEGLPAIAMELVPGDPLEDLLVAHPGGLPLAVLEPAFAQIASALAALHAAGVVHRGLSPRSVMLDASPGHAPRLKVLDFGIAMLRGRSHASEDEGTRVRTLAPEQVIGRTVPASDVFAMGAMLWWALTGQPYRSDAVTLEELQRLELEGRSRLDPRALVPDLPPTVSRLVGDMLAYSEHERPTAEEFLATWPRAVAELRARPPRRAHRPSVPPPPTVRPPTGKAVRGGPRPAATPPLPPVAQPHPHVDPIGDPPSYDSLPMVDVFGPSPVGPRVLVVDANAITQHMLVGYLRRNGCRVHGTHDPREATRSAADDYDLVVLSTEIPDADPLDVVRYLQEDRPEQWVVLAGEGTLDAELRSAGVREILPVPGGLPRLGELVDLLRGDLSLRDSTPADDPDAVDMTVLEALRADDPEVVQETVEIFLGQTPEALARIAEGQALGDAKIVQGECRTLATSARALGANHLARLAQAAAELARDGDLEHVPGFVHEMEREYGLVFRALMDVHTASTRRAHGGIR